MHAPTSIFRFARRSDVFALDVGAGRDPASWQPIGQSSTPVAGGLLAIWQTGGLAPGEYTIRLRVSTPEGYTVTSSQTVTFGP